MKTTVLSTIPRLCLEPSPHRALHSDLHWNLQNMHLWRSAEVSATLPIETCSVQRDIPIVKCHTYCAGHHWQSDVCIGLQEPETRVCFLHSEIDYSQTHRKKYSPQSVATLAAQSPVLQSETIRSRWWPGPAANAAQAKRHGW